MTFMRNLWKEIESQLQNYAEQDPAIINGDDDPKEISKIADIEFIFDNSEIMALLQKRANALKKADFSEAEKIEQQMTKVKNENFDDIVRPRLVYVTFMHEEGCEKLEKMRNIKFMDDDMEFRQAKNPSNFYWENIQIKDKDRNIRGCCIVTLMVGFFCVFFLIAMVTIKHKL